MNCTCTKYSINDQLCTFWDNIIGITIDHIEYGQVISAEQTNRFRRICFFKIIQKSFLRTVQIFKCGTDHSFRHTVIGLCNSAGYRSDCITVPSDRNRIPYGILKIYRFKEGLERNWNGSSAGDVELIRRPYLIKCEMNWVVVSANTGNRISTGRRRTGRRKRN